MALTARYWTKIFVVFVILSYIVAYLFLLVYMWIDTVRRIPQSLQANCPLPAQTPVYLHKHPCVKNKSVLNQPLPTCSAVRLLLPG